MKEKILVTGATGNIGSGLVRLLIEKGETVLAGVHSPEKASDLEALGAKTVKMDFNDPDGMARTMAGVEKVFSISPLIPGMVELGINFVKAAKLAGVGYIVRSSGMGADSPDAITLGRWHRQVEIALEESGIPYTILRPNSFMQNYITFASDTVKNQNAFYFPSGEGKVSVIDVRDIAAVAAAILTCGGHEGKAYELTGPTAISNNEVAEILSETLGRKITYVDIPEEDAKNGMLNIGMPKQIVDVIIELYRINKVGHASAVSSTVEHVLGKPAISFDQFAKDYVQAFK